MDNRRMMVARDLLVHTLIHPLIELISKYATYSESEKVLIVFSNAEEFFFGDFFTKDQEWMGINLGTNNTFELGFGGRDCYEPAVPVSLNDLLPSNRLNVVVPTYFDPILMECRDQYLNKMRDLMDEI